MEFSRVSDSDLTLTGNCSEVWGGARTQRVTGTDADRPPPHLIREVEGKAGRARLGGHTTLGRHSQLGELGR